ncbi:MAG: hypothetical protein Ct9H300mP25_13570 [Acidobacteriota bacterium]|nr:MAG: hypothetical protein Ct9H300mP25_13570 [Acidobacteriota bacterium]
MIRKLSLFSLVALIAVAVACGGGTEMESMPADEPAADAAPGPTTGDGTPMFEVDPFWPKPMPNNWLLGSTIGVAVDSRDHVWVVHRGNLGANEMPAALDPPFAEECCHPAPPILEFDPEGI